MKKVLLSFTMLVVLAFFIHINGQQLAFPGAEGFGRYTTGARGVANPQVYRVTTLEDSGAGSLRDAVSQPGRIVVFDVSGVIKLKSRLVLKGNSYIAGQTAPGDGVIIYGNGVSFSGASNLIVRYLRIYMGTGGDSGKDAAAVANGKTMIFDHLSCLWGRDETFSISWDNKGSEPADITIQNTIIGQGLETHSCGGLIQTSGGVSIIGCLYIDNKTRNPKVKGLNQFINNVVYNWGSGGGYIMGDSAGDSWAWIEGNYYINGPSNNGGAFVRANQNFQAYMKDNKIDSNRDGALNGSTTTDGFGSKVVSNLSAFSGIPKAHPAIAGGILTPEKAYENMIASVGASLPARSEPDKYLIAQLQTLGKEGKLITRESDNGISNNVGTLKTGTKATDSDEDGMPDWWEDANELNKNDKSDATQKAANGYLNIENYLSELAKDGPAIPYKDSDNTITSATINGEAATIDQSTGTISCLFPQGATLGTWPVTFAMGSGKASADFTSSNTHNFANGSLSIVVTAESGDKKTYTVSATVATGKIVGLLSVNGKAESYDNLFLSAFSDYTIKHLTAEATAPSNINTFYEGCDLIVVHANVGGDNATLMATRSLVGAKPILSMKAFCYTNGRWSWSSADKAPQNTDVGVISSNVATALQNHNIFEGVTFSGQTLTFYSKPTTVKNGVQYAAALDGTNWSTTINNANHILATVNSTGSQIHEVNLNNAAKYLMVGLSMEGEPSSYTLFNDNTVTMLKNAARYLLDAGAYYDYATNQPHWSITGEQVIKAQPEAVIYPAFTTGDINITGKNVTAVEVITFTGQLVKRVSDNVSFINIGNLPDGVYLVKVHFADGSVKNQKIILKK